MNETKTTYQEEERTGVEGRSVKDKGEEHLRDDEDDEEALRTT